MPKKRVLPLGFIDRTTDEGAIIMLTRPSDSHNLRPETPVTLWRRSAEEPLAMARVRGLITSVGYVTATFKVVETHKTPHWPKDEQVLQRGTPVFQALPDSFEPDPAKTLSKQEADSLSRLAARYREIARPQRPKAVTPHQPPRNGTTPDS